MAETTWWRRLFGTRKGRGKTGTDARSKGERVPRSGRSAADQPVGRAGKRPDPDTARPVLGVDVGAKGWVGALLEPAGHGTPAIFLADTVAGLLEKTGPVAVVAIDIPIGLPDETRREADIQARKRLPGKASSVFTTPVRDAVYAATYGEANAINRERIGSGLSQQAYALRTKIIEVDAWLRQDLDTLVVECHPEVSFAQMTGSPILSRKRTADGAQDRRRALARAGVYAPTGSGVAHGVGVDDLLDACAAAWTAHRVKTGTTLTFPETPETFSDGLPAAIHA